MADAIRAWWDAHRVTVLRVVNVLLALYAVAKLGDEFRRLLFQYDLYGAIDLRQFKVYTQAWIDGRPVYQEINGAIYPPASYVLHYLLVGWMDFATARWFWALCSIVSLVIFAALLVRASRSTSRLERTFVVLMLLSMNATGVTIGNGQIVLLLLPMILIALKLLSAENRTLKEELGASALFLFALIKPSISIPFGWLVFLSPRGWRPVALIGTGYAALTLIAASFQTTDLVTTLNSWLALTSSSTGVTGYANLTIWLADLGLKPWSQAAYLFALLGLGFWIYRHRFADGWVLLGVTAIFTRFWIYHRVYDDALVVLATLALFRVAKLESRNLVAVLAGVLVAATMASMLMLANWEVLPAPFHAIYIGGHTLVWLADLFFLLAYAMRQRSWSDFAAA